VPGRDRLRFGRRGALAVARGVAGWPARRVGLAVVAGALIALLGMPVLAHPPTTLIPASQTIAIGDDASVAAHDVAHGLDAIFRVSGPIQPIGRCPEQTDSADGVQPRHGYYNSIWITGCEPGGTGEVRLVERDNESNVIARATIVVVQYTHPSHIRNLTQTTQGDGTLGVSWDAPRRTGGSAIVGYGVQHRLHGDEWASEVPAARDTSGTGTSHTITGLTNGQKYHIRVTPCNQQSGCLPWSDEFGFSHASVSGRPEVPRPRNLDIRPLRDRKVRLTWTWTGPEADSYVISARGFGVDDQSNLYAWRRIHTNTTSPSVLVDESNSTYKYKFEFYIHTIYKVQGLNRHGLQHHPAY